MNKEDARRVIAALNGAEFFGNRLHAEVASDRDYSSDNRRGKGKGFKSKEKPVRKSKDSGKKDFGKKPKGARKGKETPKERPAYHGNYDIFKKK